MSDSVLFVRPSVLTAESQCGRREAAAMKGLHVTSVLDAVGQALPGSSTAAAAPRAGIRLEASVRLLGEGVEAHADAVSSSCESFVDTDARCAKRIEAAGRRNG